MVSDRNAGRAFYSSLNFLTPIKAIPKRIKLQHKVHADEKNLLYELLFHVCRCAAFRTI